MKITKTYGIYNLLEWHGTIEQNGVKMKLDFTNGSVTAYGVAPATFTTSSPLTQAFIENSQQFKNGRIRIVRKVEIREPGDEAPKEQPKAKVYPSVQATQPKEQTEKKELTQVTFKLNEEAKEYLADKFGVARSKLLRRADIEAVALENGIQITWAEK